MYVKNSASIRRKGSQFFQITFMKDKLVKILNEKGTKYFIYYEFFQFSASYIHTHTFPNHTHIHTHTVNLS